MVGSFVARRDSTSRAWVLFCENKKQAEGLHYMRISSIADKSARYVIE
jgi:hypothetical protein